LQIKFKFLAVFAGCEIPGGEGFDFLPMYSPPLGRLWSSCILLGRAERGEEYLTSGWAVFFLLLII
jgi:hypothetical protein